MAVLCDWEIQARCSKSQMVVPFNPDLLNPASLDVLLGDHLMVENVVNTELMRVDISQKSEHDPFMLQPGEFCFCLLYTSPSPRDRQKSRMPSSA